MIRSLLQPPVLGCAEKAEELRAHYWPILDRLGLVGGSRAERAKVIGVTSCQSGEGVSTVAVSLAVTAASFGQGSVLLIDANFDRPAAHRLLGVKASPGLAEVLANRSQSPAFQPSAVANLSILAAGAAEKCSVRALAASSFAELVAGLQKSFVLIVVDLPSIEVGGFTMQMASSLDGVLLVVEAERVHGEVARRRKELLAQADARLLGVVLNKQRRYVPASLERWM